MTPQRIIFFGSFGTPNLGNEATLQAIVGYARSVLPSARLECVCPRPEETAQTHGICAHAASYRNTERFAWRTRPPKTARLRRLLRLALYRLPREVFECVRVFPLLRATQLFIVPGTGILGAYGTQPLGQHYELLKWTLLAKFRGCKIVFLSVGGGRLDHPLSRWFIRIALSLADYRSYRDSVTKAHLGRIGFNTSLDSVYPDLAFSLPAPADVRNDHDSRPRVVGVGVIDYYRRELGTGPYRNYLASVAALVDWLLERRYVVRLLIGDTVHDEPVRGDVLAEVSKRKTGLDDRLISEPVHSPSDLLSHLAATDIVVASRYHNILLGLMLNKPAISISYDDKNDALMTAVGLGEYCHRIEHIEVHRLVKQVVELDERRVSVRSRLQRRVDQFRVALDTQYESIFSGASSSPLR